MLNQREITDIFLERIRKSRLNEGPAPTEAADVLRLLPVRPGYRIFKAAETMDEWKNDVSETMEALGNFFQRAESPRVAGVVDYSAAEGLLFWLNSLGRYAIETGDWAFLRSFHEIFVAVVIFFTRTDSIYVRANGCYIETRMKNEFPFIEPNTIIISSVLNSMWHEYLSFLSMMGTAFPNIKLAGPVEEVLSHLTSAFAHDFWDDASGDLRFAITAASAVRSGYCILVLDPPSGGLLFKQKRKKYLNLFPDRWYTDLGIVMQTGVQNSLRPDLLPVFWSAKQRISGFTQNGKKAVSELVIRHFGHIDPLSFGLTDRLYNNRMCEFLLANSLDFIPE
jgi:hypothetical protein